MTTGDMTDLGNPTTPESPETDLAGVALFRELARVVVELGEPSGLRSFRLPYPAGAQRALDRTVLRCLELGQDPPKSVPELMEWCRRRPAGDRLFGVPDSLVAADATLVHPIGKMPTRTALELASQGLVAGGEGEAVALLAELERRCDSPTKVHQCRRFLALHAVVHQQDRFRPGWNKDVWSRVKDLYAALPECLQTADLFLCCRSCRLPALVRSREALERRPLVAGPETWCEGESCAPGTHLEVIRSLDRVRLLRKSLRVFLALPFRTEEIVLESFTRAQIRCEAVQGKSGVYRLHGRELRVRMVHVYDRVQPALLAARFTERIEQSSEPSLAVVPQELADSARYRSLFEDALPDLLKGRALLSGARDLVHHVQNSITETEGDMYA